MLETGQAGGKCNLYDKQWIKSFITLSAVFLRKKKDTIICTRPWIQSPAPQNQNKTKQTGKDHQLNRKIEKMQANFLWEKQNKIGTKPYFFTHHCPRVKKER